MGKAVCLFVGFCATGLAIACARNDPPGTPANSPAATHSVHVSAESSAAASATTTSAPVVAQSAAVLPLQASPTTTASIAATALPAPEQHQDPQLLDAAGQPLPQTDQRPDASSSSFQRRMTLLCQAIIDAEPAKAHDAFFPAVAYAQVKAVADPDRDYRLRLLAHFDRDILDYHRRISRRPGPLHCAGVTVPDNLARWMKPGSEYNKLGYFRLLRSHINLVDAAEKTTSLEVTSLISWRGQWYVVHLNGFE